jgi:hypothetical protein
VARKNKVTAIEHKVVGTAEHKCEHSKLMQLMQLLPHVPCLNTCSQDYYVESQGFWSLTIYDKQLNLVANPINRYAVSGGWA